MSRRRAADVLADLYRLRLERRSPARPVYVTTEERWTELYTSRQHAVVEVWRRDLGKLDWRCLAGLQVVACVSWTDQAERLALFEELRDAQPAELTWYAVDVRVDQRRYGAEHHTWLGCMWLKNGEPIEWHTPFDRLLQALMEEEGGSQQYLGQPLKPGEQLVSYGRV